MMAGLEPIKAIYIPRIEFHSVGWAKAALLYWEGLLRFVPEGVKPSDPPDIYDLVVEGLVENLSPSRYFKAAREALIARFDKVLEAAAKPAGGTTDEDTLIHRGLVDPELLRELENRNLARASRDWARMSPGMAELYKTALTCVAGADLHAAPATDESGGDVAAYFARMKLVFGPQPDVPVNGFAWARGIDPFPALETSGALSTQKLIKIREAYRSQRRSFRDAIQAQVSAVAELSSEEAIRGHVKDRKKEMDVQVREQRRAMRTSMVRDTLKILGVSAPASIGSELSLTGAPPLLAAVGLVGSVGLGVTEIVAHRKQRIRAAHYLLLLESELSGLDWQGVADGRQRVRR
jgi:hypothetical protein